MPGLENIYVKKASGQLAIFDPDKLKKSLARSGASGNQIAEILIKIEKELYNGISTKILFQKAFKWLIKDSRPLAARYKLKYAIMELGPSGFPFEKYVAAILRFQKYQVQTGISVQGKCIRHEVDVIAEKDENHFMIECKYHNQLGSVCDVKVPLYIFSRFKDIEAIWVKLPGHNVKIHQGWVVTNTRFTTDAIQYGTCVGLYLLGWDYPPMGSLNEQIDYFGLYPLTCLSALNRMEKQYLLDKKVVLCHEICENPNLLEQAGVNSSRINQVLDEGRQLCHKLNKNGTRSH